MTNKIFIIILFFLINSCNLPYHESNLHQNYYQKGLKFTLKTAREIEKENNLKLLSYGINNNGNMHSPDYNAIHDFSFSFIKIGKFSIDDARRVLYLISDEILKNIHNDENIKKYLYNYPFNVKNLYIALHFEGENDEKIYGKYIDMIILRDGVINYSIIPDENSTMQTYEESYEDAANIVKNNIKTEPVFK